jgi:hypothetical protein
MTTITETITYTRANTSIDWSLNSNSSNSSLQSVYDNLIANKNLTISYNLSNDNLVKTIERVWTNEEDFISTHLVDASGDRDFWNDRLRRGITYNRTITTT